ncbi:hypothetical protein PV327_006531 [Microctonus hyperodae]|uniref:Peptidase M12B domain-containing protein n=1 Tax=Microctonus hyperodae TaxID=165561 RepID=A0AA39F4J1_MICHY|nr:hypothetical protein PV327_006531 [Microctonus hyperodae]
MFSTTLIVIVVLVIGTFEPVLGSNGDEDYYYYYDEDYPIESLPENEYFNSEKTPIESLLENKYSNGEETPIESLSKNKYLNREETSTELLSNNKYLNREIPIEILPQKIYLNDDGIWPENEYSNVEGIPIELLPENEYLIGEETPIYFIRIISGQLETRWNMIKNGFVIEERQRLENASTKFVKLSPDITPQILLSRNVFEPHSIQPEILVIVDFDLYSRFGKDWRLIFPYVITFWNAVDLKFRTLHSPSYRLSIAGIIIAETSDALSYIDGFKFLSNGRDYVSIRNSLHASSHWLYENRDKFAHSDYDMAVTMTSNLLCNHDENEIAQSCTDITFGMTYQGRACHEDHYERKTYKTAIIYNEGAYDRTLAAAHTISLLMGTECNSLRCHDQNNYYMVDVPQIQSSTWTADQINALKNFINIPEKLKCLKYQSPRGKKLQTYLPGKIMDANEQCQRMNFAGVYNIDSSICTQLKCVSSDRFWNNHILETEAADGTTCGPNQICLNSRCVSEQTYNKPSIPLFVVTILVPALARYWPEQLENINNTLPKLELLPQNEYLIGENTPVYFLENVSGKLETYSYTIKSVFTQSQRTIFDKAATSRIALSPEEQTYTSEQSDTSNQYTLNPEILVIVDYDLYVNLDRNWETIIPYVVTFWNAVDLKFRSVETLTYRLNIAGIIVAFTPDALPYIRDFKITNDMNVLDAKNSLDASAAWLYKNKDKFPLSDYDIAVTMTSNMLCKNGENERCEDCEGTFGVTYQARACHDNHSDRKTYKTAIIRHEGVYDRVLAAAHTISLLMSTRCHSPRCNDPDEYIFADVPDVITSSDWSNNQLRSFENFYGDIYKSYCLATDPERGTKLPTYLPGRIMNANQQCKKLRYSGAYKIDASICKKLICRDSNNEEDQYYFGYEAADGTECGNGKMCLHSKCVNFKSFR